MRKTEPGRTHAERRQEAERRILAAALEITAERGLDQLTLAEAGEAAGYSRALPAHYFGTREAMLAAVVEHAVEAYRRRLRARGARPQGLEALLASFDFYINDSRRSPKLLRAFYEVLNSALTRPSLAPVVARLNRDTMQAMARSLREAAGAGEVRSDLDFDAAAMIALGALRGLMTQWLLAPETVDLDIAGPALIQGFRSDWRAR